jgi:hypothetical protein
MNIVVIGKVWPEPSSSAAGTRTMGLIEAFLEAGWSVTFASSAQPTEYSIDLIGMGVTTQRIAVNDSSFDRWIAACSPDVVLFDRYMIEEQFGWRVERACPQALRVLDTSDLHCLRAAREQQVQQGGGLNLFNEVALREIASIFRSDLSLMISEFEMQLLHEDFKVPASQLCYLPLMLPEPDACPPDYESRQHFMVIGSYLHAPNWDGVRWCCQSIWPLIRRELPDAELHLYGSYEPSKARQLADRKQGIVFYGRAPSALKTMERYRVNLAPLRFGAGQKGKVADGWLSGTPTIATPIAAESMPGGIDWGCAVIADSEGFAQTAVDVYRCPQLWLRVQEQGLQIVRKRFLACDWRPRLVASIETLRIDNRHQQFTGRMLRYHLHRSTEFMSRWIEEKNRYPRGNS